MILIFIAIYLFGAVADFIIVRAYWKANDCWGNPIDIFLAAVIALVGSWLGVGMGLVLMGPPWNPVKLFKS